MAHIQTLDTPHLDKTAQWTRCWLLWSTKLPPLTCNNKACWSMDFLPFLVSPKSCVYDSIKPDTKLALNSFIDNIQRYKDMHPFNCCGISYYRQFTKG